MKGDTRVPTQTLEKQDGKHLMPSFLAQRGRQKP